MTTTNIINKNFLSIISKESSDISLIVAVIGILMAMILPIPPFMLDFFLALNITFAISILIITMYTKKPLDFHIFPSLLLILTLFSLSLNVASTRLILLYGNEGEIAAGQIIKSFGNFVVGGNYVVGFIIFCILVIINFMVITKGSVRIAEVSARFTLDAMPGKQMAIDSDLSTGLISEKEAVQKRKELSMESEFYGSMDGASKFVRGDAIAGIIITFINIAAGFAIGVIQKDMDMLSALSSYALLTIGDGLVTQIPALIISTSAGILISRSNSNNRMGFEVISHLFKNSTPIYIALTFIFCLGLIPGFPSLPFMGLAIILSVMFYLLKQKSVKKQTLSEEKINEKTNEKDDLKNILNIEMIELKIGGKLFSLINNKNHLFFNKLKGIRKNLAESLGLLTPSIAIKKNLNLKENDYSLSIKGVEMAKGNLLIDNLLAVKTKNELKREIKGKKTKEPTFGLDAVWISNDKKNEAEEFGYSVFDVETVIATHILETLKNNAYELLGKQEVYELLDNLSQAYPRAVEDLTPKILPINTIQKVLQNLLIERISIKNMLTIVEALADYGQITKDPILLTEYVRKKIARFMLSPFITEDNSLKVITIDKSLEEYLINNIKKEGKNLLIEPELHEKIFLSMKEEVEKVLRLNLKPLILCNSSLRIDILKIARQISNEIFVISYNELITNINIQTVAKIKLIK